MQHAQWNIAQACEHSTTCRNAVRFAQEARLDMETMAKILAERHPRACLPTAFLFRALRVLRVLRILGYLARRHPRACPPTAAEAAPVCIPAGGAAAWRVPRACDVV